MIEDLFKMTQVQLDNSKSMIDDPTLRVLVIERTRTSKWFDDYSNSSNQYNEVVDNLVADLMDSELSDENLVRISRQLRDLNKALSFAPDSMIKLLDLSDK